MRILVASDSFKDGCNSIDACLAIAEGIESVNPDVDIEICPISDGGEGAAMISLFHFGGEHIEVKVSDPLFKQITARYLLLPNGVAFIEMAEASGLEWLTTPDRNPMNTSTFGTGELIIDALARGCTEIIISVGGSATNDLGMGMGSALGWKFLDSGGNSLAPIGFNMSNVVEMDSSMADSRIAKTHFTVMTDVTNPLYGPEGAAHVYARQKGADNQAIVHLDKGMKHLWTLLSEDIDNLTYDGSGYGAAGGLAAGCVAMLNADIESGFPKLSELINLKDKIAQADIIITGEGHLDRQTMDGKVISGIAKMSNGKQLIVFCGKNELDASDCKTLGINTVIEISSTDQELEEALEQTEVNLEQQARLWAIDNL